MDIKEAIAFIENEFLQNQSAPSHWADLGCGSGLFTRALSYYLKPGSKIYAVDKANPSDLKLSEEQNQLIPIQGDFEKDSLPVPKLDGILMANSLHYVRDKYAFLTKCRQSFSNDSFLIIEYDTDTPVKHWVPYPVSFTLLSRLFESVGFHEITKLKERRSVFGDTFMYAALIQ